MDQPLVVPVVLPRAPLDSYAEKRESLKACKRETCFKIRLLFLYGVRSPRDYRVDRCQV